MKGSIPFLVILLDDNTLLLLTEKLILKLSLLAFADDASTLNTEVADWVLFDIVVVLVVVVGDARRLPPQILEVVVVAAAAAASIPGLLGVGGKEEGNKKTIRSTQ